MSIFVAVALVIFAGVFYLMFVRIAEKGDERSLWLVVIPAMFVLSVANLILVIARQPRDA
jgi:hypothetical protein